MAPWRSATWRQSVTGDRGQGQPLLGVCAVTNSLNGLPIISDYYGLHSCRRKYEDRISYALYLHGHVFVGAGIPAEQTTAAVPLACRCIFHKDIQCAGKKYKHCLKQSKVLLYLDLV